MLKRRFVTTKDCLRKIGMFLLDPHASMLRQLEKIMTIRRFDLSEAKVAKKQQNQCDRPGRS
jgi:hypothetical protein